MKTYFSPKFKDSIHAKIWDFAKQIVVIFNLACKDHNEMHNFFEFFMQAFLSNKTQWSKQSMEL